MRMSVRKEALVAMSRRVLRVVLLLVVPLVVVVAGVYVYAKGGRFQETENAYVKANIVAISATVNGKVIEVLTQDNEPVKAGAGPARADRSDRRAFGGPNNPRIDDKSRRCAG